MLKPEELCPFPKYYRESHLIEVYKKGTLEECQDFFANIEDADLRSAFEIMNG